MPQTQNQVSQLNLIRNSFARVWQESDCEAKLAKLAEDDFPLFMKLTTGLMPRIRVESPQQQQAALPAGDIAAEMLSLGTRMMRQMRADGRIKGFEVAPDKMIEALPEFTKDDAGEEERNNESGSASDSGGEPSAGREAPVPE